MKKIGKATKNQKDENKKIKEALQLEEDTIIKLCPECKVVIHEKLKEFRRCLEECLEERKKVEKAKWILVKKKGIEEEEAHKILLASARRQSKRLGEIAEAVIESEKFLEAIANLLPKKKQDKS